LKLCRGFRHRRAAGGPSTGGTPAGDGFFDKPGLLVMLREELGLVIHELGRMGFECRRDPRVQLLSSAAQQAAVSRILDQHVL